MFSRLSKKGRKTQPSGNRDRKAPFEDTIFAIFTISTREVGEADMTAMLRCTATELRRTVSNINRRGIKQITLILDKDGPRYRLTPAGLRHLSSMMSPEGGELHIVDDIKVAGIIGGW